MNTHFDLNFSCFTHTVFIDFKVKKNPPIDTEQNLVRKVPEKPVIAPKGNVP